MSELILMKLQQDLVKEISDKYKEFFKPHIDQEIAGLNVQIDDSTTVKHFQISIATNEYSAQEEEDDASFMEDDK